MSYKTLDKMSLILFIIATSNAFISVFFSTATHAEDGYQENTFLIKILLVLYVYFSCRLFGRLVDFIALLLRTKVIILLILFSFFSLLIVENPSFALQKIIALSLSILAAYYIVLFFKLDELMKLLLSSFFIMLLTSIILGLLFPLSFTHTYAAHYGLLHGVFPQKQVVGQVASLACLILYTYRESFNKKSLIVMFSTFLISLIFSGSRTAIIITLSILGLMLFFDFSKKITGNQKSTVIVTVLYVSFVLAYIGFIFVAQFFDLIGKDMSFSGRIYLWDFVLDKANETPWFGAGYKSFWPNHSDLIFLLFGYKAVNGHSLYLDMYLELGLVGSCLYFVFTFKYFSLLKNAKGITKSLAIVLALYILFFGLVTTIFPNQNSIYTILVFVTYLFMAKNNVNKKY